MARYNRKNRAIVSGILVGLASIYAIASHFDLEMSELHSFLSGTLILFALILLLAVCALLLIKGFSRLFRSGNERMKIDPPLSAEDSRKPDQEQQDSQTSEPK